MIMVGNTSNGSSFPMAIQGGANFLVLLVDDFWLI
jgi:hypothetical protein